MRGHASCASNAREAIDAMIVREARLPCAAADGFGQVRDVFMLVGVESASLESIIGLFQYSAAAPVVSPFEATPYP